MQRVSEFTGNRVVLRIANVPSVVAVRSPGIGHRVPESRTVFQDTRPSPAYPFRAAFPYRRHRKNMVICSGGIVQSFGFLLPRTIENIAYAES